MMDTITRARLIGALLLVLAFGAGVAVGRYVMIPGVPEGIVVSVKSSGRIPKELEDLDLTDAQRVQVREIIQAGTRRAGRVMRSFMEPMNAAIDSTDREIRSILTEVQVRRLDEIRKAQPLKRMQEKRVIDTSR